MPAPSSSHSGAPGSEERVRLALRQDRRLALVEEMQRGRWWSWAAVAATLPLTVAAFFLPSPFEETVLAAWGFLVWRAARASRRAHRIRELELPRLED